VFLSERVPALVRERRFDDGLGKSSKDTDGSSEGGVLDARLDDLTNNIQLSTDGSACGLRPIPLVSAQTTASSPRILGEDQFGTFWRQEMNSLHWPQHKYLPGVN